MKGSFLKTVILGSTIFSFALFNSAFADNNNAKMVKKGMWKCETNASSSSNAADQKADQMMKDKAEAGKKAFDFAMQHCRDCTKITCTMENS